MKIPNFKTEEGSILYKNTVGRLISPRVAQVLLTRVTEQLNPDKQHTILDLGCGPGTVCLPLAKEFPGLAITAVDTSDSMVQLAKSEAEKLGLRNIRFGDMDAGHIGVSNDAFDIVLCNLAFPFFARPYDSMREILSVMRPQAAAYFTVPGRHTWDEFFEVAASVLGNMVSMARPFLSKFSQAEILPEAMSAVGFKEIVEERTLLPFEFADGQAVLEFFGQLFHLLDYATSDMKSELADAINAKYPNGFRMHYEVELLTGTRAV